jgi:hypothetical protein
MYLLDFSKEHHKGFLRGLTTHHKLNFVSINKARLWIDSILAQERKGKLSWKLVNFIK